jgi:hypothetical protein
VVPALQPMSLRPYGQFCGHPRLYAAPELMGFRNRAEEGFPEPSRGGTEPVATAVPVTVSGPTDERRDPVFLLATARSYSTVTLAVLAGHPDMYGFPEMLAFTEPTLGDLFARAKQGDAVMRVWRGSQLTGIARAVADLHEHSQSDEAVDRAYAWLAERAEWPGPRLLDHLLELAHPRVGLEKSPGTAGSDEALDRCLRHYPRARLIHLTRHPVSTQRSMQAHWRRLFPDPRYRSFAAASAWYRTHRRIVAALDGLPPERWLRIRAEDVLREPRRWLPRILAWLGLDHDDRVVDLMLRTERWRFANAGPSGRLYGGDPTFLADPCLRPVPEPGPVVFDDDWGLPDGMYAAMSTLARTLGY